MANNNAGIISSPHLGQSLFLKYFASGSVFSAHLIPNPQPHPTGEVTGVHPVQVVHSVVAAR